MGAYGEALRFVGNTVRSKVVAERTDMIAVYLITNIITGAKYVGASIDVQRRFMEHRTPNASLTHKSKRFVDDVRQYGIDSFKFEILEECGREDLSKRELYWIHTLEPEYNTIGRPMPESIKEVLRDYGRKQWAAKSDEEKRFVLETQLIGPKIGHPVSEETRQKLREANQGKSRYGVRVVETGTVYSSARECAAALGCCICSVRNQLRGRTETTKGYHLERVETNRDECSGVGWG